MAKQETGKQRASRIPLDYFKRQDALSRVKLGLAGLALLVAVVWAAAGLLRPDAGNMRYSRGPVASVHAAWDAECAACHVAFTPMAANNWMHVLGKDHHLSDQRCQSCHAGPDHHATQRADSTPSCAACHRDHRGREALLTLTPDSLCTNCHVNLAQHLKPDVGRPPEYESFSRFEAGSHPEFKMFRDGKPTDPGRIKFNHKLHMTPGMIKPNGAAPWTLARVEDKVLRERYSRLQEDKADSAPVKLECATCHQLDSGDFGITKARAEFAGLPLEPLLPKRSAGAMMLPITYENQCKACHPINVDVKPVGPAESHFRDLPHRVQPSEMRKILEGLYASQYLLDNKLVSQKPLPTRPLPGARLLDPGEEKAAKTFVAERVALAERSLYAGKKTCGECHYFDPPLESPKFPRDVKGVEEWDQVRIVAANVPAVWFRHARFDHAAHRAMHCRECHPGANPDNEAASTVHSDVLLPGVENCLQCHAPRRGTGSTAVGGVRSDCVTCHTYHHGDEPLQGPGAAARDPRHGLGTRDFLSGARDR